MCEDCVAPFDYPQMRWFKKVSPKNPVAVCRDCNEEKETVPVEEGEIVGVGSFECHCENAYTVICRGIDTAMCYECEQESHPIRVNPRGIIKRKTSNLHSCSRCNHGKIKPCPNFVLYLIIFMTQFFERVNT